MQPSLSPAPAYPRSHGLVCNTAELWPRLASHAPSCWTRQGLVSYGCRCWQHACSLEPTCDLPEQSCWLKDILARKPKSTPIVVESSCPATRPQTPNPKPQTLNSKPYTMQPGLAVL